MKFDIYGRFQVEMIRNGECWSAYRVEPGKRIALTDFSIPGFLSPDDIATYLDDIYHEMGGPGDVVRPIP